MIVGSADSPHFDHNINPVSESNSRVEHAGSGGAVRPKR